jgi:hypothetical protein
MAHPGPPGPDGRGGSVAAARRGLDAREKKPGDRLATPTIVMGNDGKLYGWLLALAGLVHAASLHAPWVGAWVGPTQLVELDGAELLAQALRPEPAPWRWLALAHAASLLTWLAAWRVPRRAWLRAGVLAALGGATVTLCVPLLLAGVWNGANAWPEGAAQALLRALSPGHWWVLSGVAAWGLAQALYVGVLVGRARAVAQGELQARWAERPEAAELGVPLPVEVLGTLPPALRRVAIDAQRLRVDLDAPVRPLDDACRLRLYDLALALHDLGETERERLYRAGLEPGRVAAVLATPRATSWLAELHVVDAGLRRLVQAALRRPSVAYR